MKWVVCQIGAREHYAVARALHRRGKLAALVTDFWVPPGSWLSRLPGMQRLRERWHPDLADAKVLSINAAMLAFELLGKVKRLPMWEGIMARNAFFQERALRLLPTSAPQAPTLFGYSYAAADLFREAKRRGWTTVLGQIDPGPEEERIVGEVSRRHGVTFEAAPPEYWSEWRKETELADRIVVNSQWSKDCLGKEGVSEAKIEVVPLAYEQQSVELGAGSVERGGQRSEGGGRSDEWGAESGEQREWSGEARGQKTGSPVKGQRLGKEYPDKFTKERPMRVLFLGQVNVRKGVVELLEAARRLKDEPLEFLLVGGAAGGLSFGDLTPNVRAIGAVERGAANGWYHEADLFVLPTHSDGFALTQLEAQAHGLPVVASKYCGDVVRDGVNGVLLKEVSAQALVDVLRGLARDPRRLESMARESHVRGEFSLQAVGELLTRGAVFKKDGRDAP